MSRLPQSVEPLPSPRVPVSMSDVRDAVRLEALGLMTAGIVHDLGNMVQLLQRAVNMIARHPQVRTTAGLEPIVAGATASLEQAVALVQQIVSFARDDRPVTEAVDIDLCLARLERLLRWICSYDVELTMALAVDLPAVVCNRRDLENAVLNLVLNARDATSAGGEIIVRGRTYEDPIIGDCVSLSVADSGAGMAPDVAVRAFEAFFTTKPGGSGLGLSIVKRFAQETGGYAIIDSKPGEGTTVELRLPVRGRE